MVCGTLVYTCIVSVRYIGLHFNIGSGPIRFAWFRRPHFGNDGKVSRNASNPIFHRRWRRRASSAVIANQGRCWSSVGGSWWMTGSIPEGVAAAGATGSTIGGVVNRGPPLTQAYLARGDTAASPAIGPAVDVGRGHSQRSRFPEWHVRIGRHIDWRRAKSAQPGCR